MFLTLCYHRAKQKYKVNQLLRLAHFAAGISSGDVTQKMLILLQSAHKKFGANSFGNSDRLFHSSAHLCNPADAGDLPPGLWLDLFSKGAISNDEIKISVENRAEVA